MQKLKQVRNNRNRAKQSSRTLVHHAHIPSNYAPRNFRASSTTIAIETEEYDEHASPKTNKNRTSEDSSPETEA
jgi:hypothetical protein